MRLYDDPIETYFQQLRPPADTDAITARAETPQDEPD